MNKVISINLGGRAYQLEEAGFTLLKEYLKNASEQLTADPDRDEIVADLEQAVADKFFHLLSGSKNVVTTAEVESIIKQMGTVEGSGASGSATEPKNEASDEKKAVKRLYRIMDGKMIGGICTGLAAYFDMDVVWVRIIFVLLTLLSQGAMIFVYLVLMLVIPRAQTADQLTAAYGEALTAQELVRRARAEFNELSSKSEWKKWKYEMKQKRRQARHEWRASRDYGYTQSGFMGILIAVFIIFWMIGLVSIISKGIIFGFILPLTWPLWAVMIAYIFVFFAVVDALSKSRSGSCRSVSCHSPFGFLFSLVWLGFLGWLIWHFFPGSHYYFHQGYEMLQRGWEAVRNG